MRGMAKSLSRSSQDICPKEMSFINYKISMDRLGWWPHRWLFLILAILNTPEPKGVKRRAKDLGTKPAAALQCLGTRRVHRESGVITPMS